VKKNILNILGLLAVFNVFSQQYIYGDIQSRYKMEKYICFEGKNEHSLSKPFQINKNQNKIYQKGIWDYSAIKDSSKFTFLPFLSLQESQLISYNSHKINYAAGLQFNYLSSKFFYQIRLGFQEGFVNNERFSSKRPYVRSIGYIDDTNSMSFSKPIFQGVISYKLNKYILLSAGNEKNTFGDGYRSLWLSDFAPTYPFMKLESTFWKVQYVNLWSLHDDRYSKGFSNFKWASSHLLSYNVTKWMNLSIFESIVWQNKDTLVNRGPDINYFNPFIFFRPVEFGIGSADNALLGAGAKFTIGKHCLIYSSFILDEFLLSEISNRTGWWGNKYGIQYGIKIFDIFKLDGLYSILEFNAVRPFTYSHISSKQNYGHKNHSLAHPLESNFQEFLVLLGYQKNNLDFSVQYHFQKYGIDSGNINFGGNMFEPYINRNGNYNHKIGQGNLVNQHIFIAQFSYMISALTNTKVFFRLNSLKSKDFNDIANTNQVFNIGISSRLWQYQQDY